MTNNELKTTPYKSPQKHQKKLNPALAKSNSSPIFALAIEKRMI